MKTPACSFFCPARFLRSIAVLFASVACLCTLITSAPAQSYLLTNDDSFTNGVSFYEIGSDGALTFEEQIPGPGLGINGGYFGMNRLAVLDTQNNQCIFASESFTGDVAWYVLGAGVAGGSVTGSSSDTGASNGIGLAANPEYLYASFSDSSNIGTFQVQAGCMLAFVGDITVNGLNGGIIDGMAIHGNLLIATYADGTIESFNIASGVPVSNGDKQVSTASAGGETYPNGIDITQDGHFVIFGDTSTADIVEVSDISSGKLTPTVVYQTHSGISSSNILLSADETILYISNTQGDIVTATFFNRGTGQVMPGCKSGRIKNYGEGFQYLAGMALQQTTGNGGGVFVAEFGSPSGIGALNLLVSAGTCTLREAPGSPTTDYTSHGLLTVGRFPPRAF
jgi:hypothetical protein